MGGDEGVNYFIGEVVALFGPEVLVALAFGPGASAAAGAQVVQDGRLPNVKALPVHQAGHQRAVGVVTQDAHRIGLFTGVARLAVGFIRPQTARLF